MRSALITKPDGLGAFKGVFLPNILQMLGIVLFMRIGPVLGSVGFANLATVIGISSCLLLITSLSMATIVSNMKVEGGGAYYLISRMLGVEFGSAIGILLCLAQHVAIAICVKGFSLSVQEFLPTLPLEYTQFVVLCTLVLVAYFSTEFALKTHVLVFLFLATSVTSIFMLSDATGLEVMVESSPTMSFWMAFALFFPVTTGIETGMSLSGELRRPARSLPLGTLASVLLAFCVYLSLAYYLSSTVSKELLLSHPFIFFSLAKVKFILLLGIWGTTLTNALSNILGAPKVLEALSKDGVLPSFLQKTYGAKGQPRAAIFFVFSLSLILILSVSIDQILPLLTMVCLVCYGLINFVAFFEGFIKNPSFRPTFRIPWALSLVGALSCFIIMLMINAGATILTMGLTMLLGLWISSRKVSGNWDDLRHGLLSFLVHRGASKLSGLKPNAKSWRPQILTLFDENTSLKNLSFFSHALDQGKGFLTFGTCLEDETSPLNASYIDRFASYNIPHYLHVNHSENTVANLEQIIKNYGIGSLRPNTVILPVQENFVRTDTFGHLIREIYVSGKNILLTRLDPDGETLLAESSKTSKEIHLWWRGSNQKNFELSLALSYTMRESFIWSGALICIKSIVTDEEEAQKLAHVFENYQKKMRIKNTTFQPIIDPEKKFFRDLSQFSKNADFTFLGLKPFEENESSEEYTAYFQTVLEKTSELKNCCFVLSGENLKFDKIFV